MRWEKLGLVYSPNREHPWMVSHASNPVADPLWDDRFRIYFSTRDNGNRSSVGYVEIRLDRPQDILRVSERPMLSPGKRGCFDDSGVSIGCLITAGNAKRLYYLGWNLGTTVPFRNSIGLAVWNQTLECFERYSEGPIIDRSPEDPISLSYPYVLQEDGRYRMWYGSNLTWDDPRGMVHTLKYAESADGIHWQRNGTPLFDFADAAEYAISRPCVLPDDGIYRMWYAYRGAAYRIGYAESPDGLHWTRQDATVGIDVSPSGWDSEMIDYPFVFRHRGQTFMLYNGNGYGRTGFGLARLTEP